MTLETTPETTPQTTTPTIKATRTVLRSAGLSCPSCIVKIERALKALDGVSSATVHFTTGRIVVAHDPTVSWDGLVEAVRALGYDARVAAF